MTAALLVGIQLSSIKPVILSERKLGFILFQHEIAYSISSIHRKWTQLRSQHVLPPPSDHFREEGEF